MTLTKPAMGLYIPWHPHSEMRVSLKLLNDYIGKIPLLYIDVNLGKDKGLQRIILYDDDQPGVIAERFA
jgi:hypothetical protein